MIREAYSPLPHEIATPFMRQRNDLHISEGNWVRVGNELRLAPRELELVQHIFAGKKLAATAEDMKIALGTAKTYAQRVRSKLGVSNRQELTMAVVCTYLNIVA